MLISFEGIDGCGKSTQIQLLRQALENQGYSVQVYREPGGTPVSEQIREILLHPDSDINPVTELLLFSAARAQLVSEKIIPALNRGEVVILDRFYDSTTAYQGYGRKTMPLADVHEINRIASHQYQPDITFYLRLSLEEAWKRTSHLQKDRMEQAGTEFFTKVVEGFEELAKNQHRIVTIEAGGTVEEVHEQILNALKTIL